jgi:serine/threonine protein kinase
MVLSPGTRLGPYEILSSLGAGGMGEVYRARDTKLGRDVALKILPDEFAKDPDRLARFEREARVLASLNHPHIAQIYGFEAAADKHLLVMELVDGDDLAARIRRGPIPVRDAIAIAAQITQALDAAHAQSVIHRDLKPANVKVRGDGTVKLLDFGIAKAFAPAVPDAATVMDTAMTERGAVVGTAAYMSPEQARGQAIDKRTDIWAFGCVLYEMLTARRAFGGATSTDVVAAVLEREPDWTALPLATPAAIRRVLARCLAKDRARRLADIADARIELEEATLPAPAGAASLVTHRQHSRLAIAVVASALVFAALGLYAGRQMTRLALVPITQSVILPSPGERFTAGGRNVAISRDGSQIAYVTDRGLYVRPVDSFATRFFAGTGILSPVFSPDGRRIAVTGIATSFPRIIDLASGALTRLDLTVDSSGILPTLAWDEHGILMAGGTAGVVLLPPDVAAPQTIVRLSSGEAATSAQMLPGGRSVLFTLSTLSAQQPFATNGQIVVQALDTAIRTEVAAQGSDARYVASGHIVYALNGMLLAVPFDLRESRVTGQAIAAVRGVRAANILNGSTHYAVSDTGTLVYIPGQAAPAATSLDLVFTDRQGIVEYLNLPPAAYEAPRLSPDGRQIAVSTDDGQEAIVWIQDLSTRASIRRLTMGGRNRFPVWSSDGKRVAFQSDREGDLAVFAQAADGSDIPQRMTRPEPGTSHMPESWSTTHLLFSATQDRRVTLWSYALADRRVARFGNVESTSHTGAVFSPDGKWVAYTARTPKDQLHTVFVQPFPATGAVYQVSRGDDGHHPVWSRDGRELFYIPGPRRISVVTVTTKPSFGLSQPTPVPPTGLMGPGTIPRNYDISSDGMRFIGRDIAVDDETRAGAPPRIHLVTNWFEALRRARN